MSKFESKWLSWTPFRRTSVSFVSSPDECLKKSEDLANRSKYSDVDKDNSFGNNDLGENPSSSCEETNKHPYLATDKTDKRRESFPSTQIPPEITIKTRVVWDAATEAIIRWFGSTKLPINPFDLCVCVRVTNPAKFYSSLREDIGGGPNGPRARTGALQEELRLLYDQFGPAAGKNFTSNG